MYIVDDMLETHFLQFSAFVYLWLIDQLTKWLTVVTLDECSDDLSLGISHREKKTEGVWEYCAQEDISTYDGRGNRGLVDIAHWKTS
jgi:hypothetical protein